ncbi:hypothetical protein ACFWY5_28290 [Nonomuraea sp. NPDC059007]|uniref:hypothetical protein n=1 Tax=Nonomuraea sp. NPDC059007 TaxID=3346692 RepID=UPI0036BFF987
MSEQSGPASRILTTRELEQLLGEQQFGVLATVKRDGPNAFALMGLGQLYFLLGGLVENHLRPGRHRRATRAARVARERAAVHQRRRTRHLGS